VPLAIFVKNHSQKSNILYIPSFFVLDWGFSINLFLAILTISGIIGAVFYFKYDYAKMIVRHKRSLSSMNVLVNPHIQRLNSQVKSVQIDHYSARKIERYTKKN